ncbi:kinase suppressor of Ras 2 [Galendromus occidentalis]|uniref:Kinase suppressor of Ras 2 n=1 Tax=Galendromus occidentalis TaxID=34638 RepID=A0AAJ7P9Y3_9ACAR|nr:kinase suppressor of Ras 2 [Galendromus occidentalis]
MEHRKRLRELRDSDNLKYDNEYSPSGACRLLQFSIDLWYDRMVRFKTKLSSRSELVRKEVRCAQSVCVQYTARQIYHRRKVPPQGAQDDDLEAFPQLDCWFRIVGLTESSIASIREITGDSFDRLFQRTDDQIKDALCDGDAEDRAHLVVALRNLRKVVERYRTTEYPLGKFVDYDEDLSWEYLGKAEFQAAQPSTPLRQAAPKAQKKPILPRLTKTPPHQRKNTGCAENSPGGLVAKSRSDLSRSDREKNVPRFTRRRLQTEPTPSSTGSLSPSRSPSFATSPDASVDACFVDQPEKSRVSSNGQASSGSNTVPRSPRLPCMSHAIRHRFESGVKVANCQQCNKPMFFGYKCKECKFRCHRDCADKVPPSCGLPNELLDVFAQRFQQQGVYGGLTVSLGSYSPCGMPKHALAGNLRGGFSHHAGDSSSTTSSCTSSAPNSPHFSSSGGLSGSNGGKKFRFPTQEDFKRGSKSQSNSGDYTTGGSKKTKSMTDSEKTVVSGNSNSGSASTDSEKTMAHRINSQDSQVGFQRAAQSVLSSREWDIPLNEVNLEGKLGEGQFGVVYRGNWHGAVAVKMLNMESASHRRRSEIMATFKQEVAIFRKTRHENLVLFMGACVKPPNLAIVTSLCKGITLYRHLHLRGDKFNLSKIASIALQVCLGMGYLHARGILHKDLKTKNIFYENGKIVITDFGLFSVVKLCQDGRKGNYLTIPHGWLCYLAPELLKDLRPGVEHPDLSFSTRSDVYAFGTVFFELLTGTWPFRRQPPESVIYQVSKGIKPSLANFQSTVDFKEILMSCWAFQAHDRPDFARLQMHLLRLPKRKLTRCPSQPSNLARSTESVR